MRQAKTLLATSDCIQAAIRYLNDQPELGNVRSLLLEADALISATLQQTPIWLQERKKATPASGATSRSWQKGSTDVFVEII